MSDYPVTECRKNLHSPIVLLTTSKIREKKLNGMDFVYLSCKQSHTHRSRRFLYYGLKMLHKSKKKYP